MFAKLQLRRELADLRRSAIATQRSTIKFVQEIVGDVLDTAGFLHGALARARAVGTPLSRV